MKRLALTALLLTLAAVLVLPGPIGHLAQQAHDRELDAAGDASSVTLEAYDRGWFATRARHRVSLAALVNEQQLVRALPGQSALIIDSEARHGPLALVGGAPLHGLMNMRSTLQLDIEGTLVRVPGAVQTRVSPTGYTSIDYRAAPASHALQDGSRVDWEASDLQLGFDRAFTELTAHGKLGRVRVAGNGDTLYVGPATVDADQRRRPSGLWLGRSEVRLDAGFGQHLSLREALFRADTSVEGDRAQASLTLSATELGFEEWRGNDARVRLNLADMDEVALARLRHALGAILSSDAHKNRRALQLELIGALQTLAAGGLDATLEELHIPSPDGLVSAQAKLQFTHTADSTNMVALLENANGALKARIPVRLMIDTASRKQGWMDTFRYAVMLGVLKPDARHYTVDASYQRGRLQINGRTLPLPF